MEKIFFCFDSKNLFGFFFYFGKDGGIEGVKFLEVYFVNISILVNFFVLEKNIVFCLIKFFFQIVKIIVLLYDIGKVIFFF